MKMPHVGDVPSIATSIAKNKNVRKWFSLIVVAVVIVVIFTIKEKKKSSEGAIQPQVTEKSLILSLKPGEEIPYQIPPRHWFRVYSKDNVEATNWQGKPFPDVAWLGDEIRDANFKLKSKESSKDAVVIITLRPK